MLGGADIISDPRVWRAIGLLGYVAALAITLRWMASRHASPDAETRGRSSKDQVKQHHGEGL